MPPGVYNVTRQVNLAPRLRIARSFYWRARGLIGRDFSQFDALAFPDCNGIHMWFMTRPLDILFIAADQSVVGLRHTLRPWRFATCRGADTVVELPAGVLASTGTQIGDQLSLQEMPR